MADKYSERPSSAGRVLWYNLKSAAGPDYHFNSIDEATTMSKNSDTLCAKLSVKVPQPDSLVEVRVTPPDSNFEVKVLPGEELIELIIRPVGSLIEVRIGPAEGAGLAEKARPAPAGEAGDEDEAADEVVKGLSRAEFDEMVEEEEGAEARKILDNLEIEDSDVQESGDTAPPSEPPPAPVFQLPEETVKLLQDENHIDPRLVEAMADPGLDYAPEAPEADEALTGGEVPEEAPEAEENQGAGETPNDHEAEEVTASGEAAGPDEPVEPGEEPGSWAGPAARAALARLSAAIGEERAAAAQPDSTVLVGTVMADAGMPDTVVVELYSDAEQPEPGPAADPPLTEEEDLDLSPVEHQEEELAIGPIDVQSLEGVDLDKSRHSGTVVKAKPMIKAL